MRFPLLSLGLASLPGLALAQDFPCAQIDARVWECTRQVRHPSGPTVTRELRGDLESQPYFREVLGARSGFNLIGDLRLLQNTDRSWNVVWPDGHSTTLLRADERPPKWIRGVAAGGSVWDVFVNRRTDPVERTGVATEEEHKLDLQLLRTQSQ